ncbi:MAG: ATP-dependent 6-phosphofructokinase [Gammaproteobacteria bacterium]|nr:MAG: ATP-dependent 6-phosphofructokinase [Gammaproteobacteria bacterium]
MTTIQRVGLLTSGGDAPGMNAAIRAVVLASTHYKIEVIGFKHGYNGLINQDFFKLNPQQVHGLINQGGTILKSARCKDFHHKNGLKQAANTLIKENIDALIVIGGDGSFNGLLALQQHWSGQVIGIPGTIDNDIDGTDHTIGFATAVNTAIDAIDKIRDTADAFERVFIVELMGRHSGQITFNVGIACAAEQVLSFENFNTTDKLARLNEIAKDIEQAQKTRQSSYIIVIAENLWPGGAHQLAIDLKQHSQTDCTACILGYIQRGGSPVAKDRIIATKMGVAAVQMLIENKSNIMIAEQNNALTTIALTTAVKHQKQVSNSLIAAQKNILAMSAQSGV